MSERIVQSILTSGKYRGLHEPLVRRVVEAAVAASGGKAKEADKRARRELHRIFGSFQTAKPRYKRWLGELEHGELDVLRALLRHHSSTQEREAQMEAFYAAVFGAVGPCESVLDVGCGLNPLTRAWAGVAESTTWFGCDVDRDQMAFVAQASQLVGHPVQTQAVDLRLEPELPPADVALLLKVIPCLDPVSWEPGADLVERLDVGAVVVSLPGATLGGRKRGMGDAYAKRFETLAGRRGWSFERLEAAVAEVVWVVRTG